MDTRTSPELRKLTDSEIELISGGTTPTWSPTNVGGKPGYLVLCPLGDELTGNKDGSEVDAGNAYANFQCTDNVSGATRGAWVSPGAGGMWNVAATS